MCDAPGLQDVLKSLVGHVKNPSELLEIYYWSQEKGVAEFVRGVFALTPEARVALMNFLRMAYDKQSISVHVDEFENLILSLQELDAVAASRRFS